MQPATNGPKYDSIEPAETIQANTAKWESIYLNMKFDMKDVLKAILLSMVLLMVVFFPRLPAAVDYSGLTG